ncbi:hypothetical protein Tco_1098899 [Tanacetum coccineum]
MVPSSVYQKSRYQDLFNRRIMYHPQHQYLELSTYDPHSDDQGALCKLNSKFVSEILKPRRASNAVTAEDSLIKLMKPSTTRPEELTLEVPKL